MGCDDSANITPNVQEEEGMKMETKSNHKKQNNRGMTLVELIVVFMLLSIFMTAAAFMISSIMNVYYQAKGTSYGMQVSKLLMDQVAGELEGASGDVITSDELTDADSNPLQAAMFIEDGRVEFKDASGSHIYIGTTTNSQDGKDYLVIHYFAVPLGNDSSAGNLYEAVDWTFDKAAYMGYSVKELSFTRPGEAEGYESNILKVELTITSPKYGDYTSVEYIECYNFDTSTTIVESTTNQGE